MAGPDLKAGSGLSEKHRETIFRPAAGLPGHFHQGRFRGMIDHVVDEEAFRKKAAVGYEAASGIPCAGHSDIGCIDQDAAVPDFPAELIGMVISADADAGAGMFAELCPHFFDLRSGGRPVGKYSDFIRTVESGLYQDGGRGATGSEQGQPAALYGDPLICQGANEAVPVSGVSGQFSVTLSDRVDGAADA